MHTDNEHRPLRENMRQTRLSDSHRAQPVTDLSVHQEKIERIDSPSTMPANMTDTHRLTLHHSGCHSFQPIESVHPVCLLVVNNPLRHLEYRSEEHTSELQSRFDLVC